MLRWTGLSVLLLSALLPDLGEANSGIVRFIRVASTPFGESLLVGNRHGRALVLAVDQSALDLSIASRPALHLEQLTRTLRRAAARGITPELGDVYKRQLLSSAGDFRNWRTNFGICYAPRIVPRSSSCRSSLPSVSCSRAPEARERSSSPRSCRHG